MKHIIAKYAWFFWLSFVLLSPRLTAAHINLLHVEGGVNPGSQDYILRSIERSEKEGAECLIIVLDTPGGLLTSTRGIVQAFFDSKVPIVVYVSPGGAHAGSAGVMVTLAAHVAAMAPGTNIGAAHPVGGQGEDIEGDIGEKVTSDAAAFAESIAKTRGRNEKWAIEAVRKSVSITADKALEIKVIDFVASSLPELIRKINGREVKLKETTRTLKTEGHELRTIEMNLKQKLIDTLANPNIAYILLMLGALGLYFELSHPGVLFPGILGGISLILGFISLQTLPINYGGLLLLLMGLALIVAEIFVPSFGIMGISGITSLILGSIFLIESPDPQMRVSWMVILPTVLSVSGIMLAVGFLVLRARSRRSSLDKDRILHKVGEVTEPIVPHGQGVVFVGGEYWTATSTEAISKGEKVIVTASSGVILTVRKSQGG